MVGDNTALLGLGFGVFIFIRIHTLSHPGHGLYVCTESNHRCLGACNDDDGVLHNWLRNKKFDEYGEEEEEGSMSNRGSSSSSSSNNNIVKVVLLVTSMSLVLLLG